MTAWYRPLSTGVVVVASLVMALGSAAQQQFSTSATIRGENIWLRTDPAEATDILAYLQRGDAVTITGAEETSRGETFVPIAVDATGEVGWVRELAIDPRSIVATDEPPAAVDAGAEEREERRRLREARETTVAVAPVATDVPPPAVELTPVPDDNCDPSYPDVCIPPPPPNLNCPDVGYQDFTVRGRDPHGFDGDNDGVGCES